SGTAIIKDIAAGVPSSNPTGLLDVNGTVFFNANDGSHGQELWTSNGAAAGTNVVKDINDATLSSRPNPFIEFNGVAYFAAEEGVHGVELWKTNGTVAGTALVADLNPGPGGAFNNYYQKLAFANVNGTLFFNATDGVN